MGSASGEIPKQKLGVEIELDDGRLIYGYLFCSGQGRLTDLLNDDRMFLPFEHPDGKFTSLKKTSFRAVTPVQPPDGEYDGNDPYRILNVARDARLDGIKQAYRERAAANHPDRLRGNGCSADEIEAATQRMTRINDAYTRLLKQYEDARPAAETVSA